jgi:hypothetical protein
LSAHEEVDLYLAAGRGFQGVLSTDARAEGTYDGRPARLHVRVTTVVEVEFGGAVPYPPAASDDPGRVPYEIARETRFRAGDTARIVAGFRSDVRTATASPVGPAQPETLSRRTRLSTRFDRVLQADEAGRATQRRVFVESFRHAPDAAPEASPPDPTLASAYVSVLGVGTARRWGRQPGVPTSPAATKWLDGAYGPAREGEIEVRACVLPTRPVGVGEAWLADADAFSRRVRGEDGVDGARSIGIARLVSVEGNVARVEAEFWMPMKPGATALGDAALSWRRGAGMTASVEASYGIDGRPVSGKSATRARILGRAVRAGGGEVNVAVEVVEDEEVDFGVRFPE